MAGVLTPKFEPLRFQAECAAPGTPLFDPVVVSERAVLIAGGPLAVGVFRVHERPRAWYTVKAQVWITGYCASGSSLYVQDGPVLSGWDLTTGDCFAAANLPGGTFWRPGPDEKGDEETVPPPAFYKIDGADGVRYAALMRARSLHAWAALLELIEEQSPSLDETVRAQAAAFTGQVHSLLQNLNAAPVTLAAAQTGLAAATAAAATMVYSAPVVRRLQEEGSAAGQIFSIALNGTVYSINDALTNITTSNFEPPWRAELMLAEPLDAAGNPGCYLYYVTANGGIKGLNATPQPLVAESLWTGKGAPTVPERVLPLRYRDGLLMGGGILGADFFAMPLDPAKGFVFTVAAPQQARGWRSYDIAGREQLVLLSDGFSSRLVAYGAGVRQRDRWGLRFNPGRMLSHTFFWPSPATDAAAPGPLLTMEADSVAAKGAMFALRLWDGNYAGTGIGVGGSDKVVHAKPPQIPGQVLYVCSEDGIGSPGHGDRVILRTATGHIARAVGGGGGALQMLPASSPVGDTERFTLILFNKPPVAPGAKVVANDYIGLQPHDKRFYIGASDREGAALHAAAPHCANWEKFQAEAPAAAPNPDELGFRVLLANTIDSANAALTSNYPPLPQPLDAGHFGRWPTPPFPIAWLRSQPVVGTQRLYCVVRSSSPSLQVAALFESGETGQRPADLLQYTLQNTLLAGAEIRGVAAATFSVADIPRAVVADAVAVFALAAEGAALRQRADAELAKLEILSRPIKVQVMRTDGHGGTGYYTEGPYPFANADLTLTFDKGPNLQGRTDAEGKVDVDIGMVGRRMSFTANVQPTTGWGFTYSIGSVVLETGKINGIGIDTFQKHGKA